MASTRRTTLGTLLRVASRSNTSNFGHIETNIAPMTIDYSADQTSIGIFSASSGPVYIKAIKFLPATAVASHATDKWTISFNNLGTAAAAAAAGNQIGTTFSTNGNALAVNIVKALASPTSEYYLAQNETLAITALKGGSAANLAGRLLIEYAPATA